MSTALEGLGFTDVETNCGEKSCSFKAPEGWEAKLSEIAEGSKLEGWSKVE